MTKERIKELVGEFSPQNITALVRCEAGLPFGGERYAIGRLRELGLIEKASWSCTEDGRQVVGELVGIPYKPMASRSSGTPAARPRPFRGMVSQNAELSRQTSCTKCGEGMPKGAQVIWIADKGVFHPDCVSS